MKIVGYGDRLSVAAGDSIEFKVSCTEPTYQATLYRPSHIEAFRSELNSPVNGIYTGRVQTFPQGSFVRIDKPVPRPETLRMELWLCPTAPDAGSQELLAWDDGSGLFIGGAGDV